jgi:glycogen operon protein
MWIDPVHFTVPDFRFSATPHRHWVRIVDTAPWAEVVGNCWPAEQGEVIGPDGYTVGPWSCVLLQAVEGRPPRRRARIRSRRR